MNISETCIRRPVLTTLMTASLIVFGVFAYRLLPVAALPAVDFPTIQITAHVPGRQSGNDGVVGCFADRAAAVDDFRHLVDELVVVARPRADHHPVRSRPQHRRRRARRADRACDCAQRLLPVEMTTPPSSARSTPATSRCSMSACGPTRCRCRRSTITPKRCWRRRFRNCRALRRCWSMARRNSPCASRSIRPRPPPAISRLKMCAVSSPRPTPSTPGRRTLTGPEQSVTLQPPARCRSAVRLQGRRRGLPQRRADQAQPDRARHRQRRERQIATWFNDARAIVLAIQRQPDANTVEVVDLVRQKLPNCARQFRRLSRCSLCLTARSPFEPR